MKKLCCLGAIALLATLANPLTARDSVAPNPNPPPSEIAVLLDFKGDYSELSVEQMKREFTSIMKPSGIAFTWQDLKEFRVGTDFPALVVVRFRGNCDLSGMRPLQHQPGAFAFAHVSDKQVMPFIEVNCDQIRGSLFAAMWGEDFEYRDFLLGRAIARVLAHEMHHVLGNTCEHQKHGLAKEALSGRDLISEALPDAFRGHTFTIRPSTDFQNKTF